MNTCHGHAPCARAAVAPAARITATHELSVRLTQPPLPRRPTPTTCERTQAIEGLETLTNLQELWLGKNKITEIVNLAPLTNLIRLDVQSNRLLALGGLDALTNLEELYIGHNAIEQLEGLDALVKLETLDATHNRLTKVDGVSTLAALTDLWLGSNAIATFEACDGLRELPSLTTVYLEHNPIASDYEYRMRLTTMVPTLTQIDATAVRR